MWYLKGLTFLILRDLELGVPVNDIVLRYNTISISAIYKIAKRNNIQLPTPERLTDEEKKEHKKQMDATQHVKKMQTKREQEFIFERPDIPSPDLPLVAMQSKGLGACNSSWIYAQSNKYSNAKEHIATQYKYGLKCPVSKVKHKGIRVSKGTQ